MEVAQNRLRDALFNELSSHSVQTPSLSTAVTLHLTKPPPRLNAYEGASIVGREVNTDGNKKAPAPPNSQTVRLRRLSTGWCKSYSNQQSETTEDSI